MVAEEVSRAAAKQARSRPVTMGTSLNFSISPT